eukprot:50963_1
MVVVILIALFIFICILIVHYKSHFQFNIRPRRADGSLTDLNQHCCAISSHDGTHLNFYPKSFIWYIMLHILLCILIIISDVIVSDIRISEPNSIVAFLFTYPFKYYTYAPNNTNGIRNLNTIYDYTIIYGVMLLSIWESLFSFWRYDTTYKTIIYLCEETSSKSVFQKFVIYALLFCALFGIQIHLYYFIFPLILCLNLVFNVYCNTAFSALLINKFNVFLHLNENPGDCKNADIINTVYFLRKISLICSVFQSISLAAVLISYDVHTIHILPILWAISSAIYSSNFIRNRIYVQQRPCKCCCANTAEEERIDYSVKMQRQTTHKKGEKEKGKSQEDADVGEDADLNENTLPMPPLKLSNSASKTKSNEGKPCKSNNDNGTHLSTPILSGLEPNTNDTTAPLEINPSVSLRPTQTSNPVVMLAIPVMKDRQTKSAPTETCNEINIALPQDEIDIDGAISALNMMSMLGATQRSKQLTKTLKAFNRNHTV